MKNTFLFTLILTLFSTLFLSGQNTVDLELEKSFKNYELFNINSADLYKKVADKSRFHILSLNIGNQTMDLELWDSGLIGESFKVTLASGQKYLDQSPIPLAGRIANNLDSDVRLTINDGFIYGYIEKGGKIMNIQPASHFDMTADKDLFVSYYDADVIMSDVPTTCGVHDQTEKLENNIKNNARNLNKQVGICYEVEIALAADWLMTQTFGSANAAENVITGILNDVQGNYDDDMEDFFEFDLADVFVSDCNSCDPWTSSTSAGALLDDFQDWAPSNFSTHDLATLWSDRNFNGSTIGLAWVGSVCGNLRYNVCEHFSNNGSLLRVVQAHEIGHNFSATHDSGGGLIMSPSVSNTNDWSTQSENSIVSWAAGAGCFSGCSSGAPPTADFEFQIIRDCVVGEVEFYDLSLLASEWEWTFEGGTPETSTAQNPVVEYEYEGVFNVELEVTNAAGDDSYFISSAIEIIGSINADFTYEGSDLGVQFTDQTDAGSDAEYLWEFGDGNDSDDQDPFHEYNAPGIYEVTLFIESDCGDSEVTYDVYVYDNPTADFTVDNLVGCANDTFQFTDLSYGLIEEWDWDFEGGNPVRSTIENPEVIYTTAGIYDVELSVENPEGQDSKEVDAYITIRNAPTAGYTYTVNIDSVHFANASVEADSLFWSFGDGNTSTDTFPTHVYGASGTYEVILNAINGCGVSRDTQYVSLVLGSTAAFTTSQSTTGCASYMINFIDQSIGNPISWNWSFPGGNPSSSTLQNPQVNYSSIGSFPVTLQISNAFSSDTITYNNYVNISDVPTMSANYTANYLTANFTSSAGNASTILWNFGDGTTSTELNPVHTYATPGTYQVSVSATNSCGTTTQNMTAVVEIIPEGSFSASTSGGCADLSVGFIDLTFGNANTWEWSFPGATPSSSNMQNPNVTYDTKGVYDVTLIVSNALGSDTTIYNNYITVDDVPTIAPTFTTDLLAATFMASVDNAQTILWNFGDGNTSTAENPVHNYAMAGNYTVTFSASNNCGTVEETMSLNVDLLPTADFGVSNNTGCQGMTVQFTDSSSSNTASWSWSFPGGVPSSSTLQNPTVQYPNVGTYDVSLTVTNLSGSNSETKTGFVQTIGAPTVSYSEQVNGNQVVLENTTSGASASWTISDGATYDTPNPTHTFASNGVYVIELEVDNGCGTDQVSFEIEIDAYPESSFELNSSSGCVPFELAFESTVPNADTYLWNFPGGTPASSSDQNPVVVYENVGVFSVSLEVSNAYGSSFVEEQDIVTVGDVPNANFEVSQIDSLPEIDLINNSVGATSYLWSFGDGATSEEENPSHTYAATGSYEVLLQATNECGTVEYTITVNVKVTTSTDELSILTNWQLAPNPSTGQVSLRFDEYLDQAVNFKVVDLTGKSIVNTSLKSGVREHTFNITHDGLYFVYLNRGDKIEIKKLIIVD